LQIWQTGTAGGNIGAVGIFVVTVGTAATVGNAAEGKSDGNIIVGIADVGGAAIVMPPTEAGMG
jgi:hypothetical protein